MLRIVALLPLLLLPAPLARALDTDDDGDDGGCELGLPMCRGIGSGAGDPDWGTAGPDD